MENDFNLGPLGVTALPCHPVAPSPRLPVAFVEVVELVEGIEEPVLERDAAGGAGVGRDVGVDRGCMVLGQAPRPALVVAARVERVAGEVEVVVEAVDRSASARSSARSA